MKTLVIYRVCITKGPKRDIQQHLIDFRIKKNDILRLLECFQLSENTACCQKSRCAMMRIVASCIILKKRLSYLHRGKDVLSLFGQNSTSFHIYIRFYLSTSPSQTRIMDFILFYNRHIYRVMQMQQLEKVHLYIIVLTMLVEQLLVFVDRFYMKGWYIATTQGCMV